MLFLDGAGVDGLRLPMILYTPSTGQWGAAVIQSCGQFKCNNCTF